MDNAGTRVEISTDRSNRQLLIGLPACLGQDSGTVTADVDGGGDFECGNIWTTKIHKHLHGNTNFLPGQERRVWHRYLFWAGRSNTEILPLRFSRAMVLRGNPILPDKSNYQDPHKTVILGRGGYEP